MGLFANIKNGLKKAGSELVKKVKYKNKVFEGKRAILSRFSKEQLVKIHKELGIPTYEEEFDILSGETKKWKKSKYDLIEDLVEYLSFEEVVEYARKYKKEYRDVVHNLEKFKEELFGEKELKTQEFKEVVKEIEEDERTFESKSEVIEILEFLESKINLYPDFSSHKEINKYILACLKERYGNENVEPEANIGRKNRIDVLINRTYGLEIKLADNPTELQRLPYQLHVYKDCGLDQIGVLIIKPPERCAKSALESIQKFLKRRNVPFKVIEKPVKRIRRDRKFIFKSEKPKKPKKTKKKKRGG